MGNDFEGTPNPLNPMGGANEGMNNENFSTQPTIPHGGGVAMDFMAPKKAPTNITVESVEEETLSQDNFSSPEPVTLEQAEVATVTEFTPNTNNEPLNVHEEESMGVVTNLDGSTPDASLDPMNRPMEKAPTVVKQKPRKMRKGYFVAMLICVLVAAACAAIAVLLIFSDNQPDPVAQAVEKILKDEAPKNLSVDGTISVINYPEISDAKIEINSTIALDSLVNSTELKFSLADYDHKQYDLDINEIYTSTGDLYFKVGGLQEYTRVPITHNYMEDNCLDEDGETNCTEPTTGGDDLAYGLLDIVSEAIDAIDDTWFRIPLNFSDVDLTDLDILQFEGEAAVCVKNLTSDLLKSKNTIKELYLKNAFIKGTTENLNVDSKNNPIYKIEIDEMNFVNFINEANGLSFMRSFFDCANARDVELDADKILDAIKDGPKVYVEIDNDYNFTRLYISEATYTGGGTPDFPLGNDLESKFTIDLNFSYPQTVKVSEPLEYIDLTNLFNPPIEIEQEEETDEI